MDGINNIHGAWLFGPAFILLLIGLFNAVRSFLGYRRLGHEAGADWKFRRDHRYEFHDVPREEYVKAYRRVHAPRRPLYMALTICALLVSTPFLIVAANSIMTAIWQLSGQSRDYEPGYLVWGFWLFFCLIGGWVLIVHFALTRFYRRAPLSLRDELKESADSPN